MIISCQGLPLLWLCCQVRDESLSVPSGVGKWDCLTVPPLTVLTTNKQYHHRRHRPTYMYVYNCTIIHPSASRNLRANTCKHLQTVYTEHGLKLGDTRIAHCHTKPRSDLHHSRHQRPARRTGQHAHLSRKDSSTGGRSLRPG